MFIEEKALSHWLDHFYGYGSWLARTWFITHEDGGGDLPEEVGEKLNFFYKTSIQKQPALINIRELYRHCSIHGERAKAELFSNLYEYRFGAQAKVSNVWKNLIAFEHGFHDSVLPDPLEYQQRVFAEPGVQREGLIKLYPLPSPHNHAWYYSWLNMPKFPFLKSRAMYQEYLYESRMYNIFQHMREHKPELVLMYGMQNINRVKKSVQEFFPDVKFKAVKGIKLLIPQHHLAESNGTTLVITTQIPTLRHNRIETGFEWYEFGKRCR